MKKTAFILSLAFALFLVSCKPEKDVGPDLTTPLVGQYFGDYLIIGLGIAPQGLTPSPAALTIVRIQRKNNNTITVTLIIKDGDVMEDKQFDAAIIPLNSRDDTLLRPGLKALYQVDGTKAGASQLTRLHLYTDGKVLGQFVYINSANQMVAVSFNVV